MNSYPTGVRKPRGSNGNGNARGQKLAKNLQKTTRRLTTPARVLSSGARAADKLGKKVKGK